MWKAPCLMLLTKQRKPVCCSVMSAQQVSVTDLTVWPSGGYVGWGHLQGCNLLHDEYFTLLRIVFIWYCDHFLFTFHYAYKSHNLTCWSSSRPLPCCFLILRMWRKLHQSGPQVARISQARPATSVEQEQEHLGPKDLVTPFNSQIREIRIRHRTDNLILLHFLLTFTGNH